MSFQKTLQQLQEVSTSAPLVTLVFVVEPSTVLERPKEHPAAQDLLDIFDGGQDPLPYLHVDLT